MKNLILLILFTTPFTIVYCQTKEIKEAIDKNGGEYIFTVVNFDKFYEMRKVEKDIKKLGYVLYNHKTVKFDRFGRMQSAYSEIVITTPKLLKAYNNYLAEQEKKRIEARKNRNRIFAGIALITIASILKDDNSNSQSSYSKGKEKEYTYCALSLNYKNWRNIDGAYQANFSICEKSKNVEKFSELIYLVEEKSVDRIELKIWDTSQRFESIKNQNGIGYFVYVPSNKTLYYKYTYNGKKMYVQEKNVNNKEMIKWAVIHWINDIKNSF